jgi:hypothetical protein
VRLDNELKGQSPRWAEAVHLWQSRIRLTERGARRRRIKNESRDLDCTADWVAESGGCELRSSAQHQASLLNSSVHPADSLQTYRCSCLCLTQFSHAMEVCRINNDAWCPADGRILRGRDFQRHAVAVATPTGARSPANQRPHQWKQVIIERYPDANGNGAVDGGVNRSSTPSYQGWWRQHDRRHEFNVPTTAIRRRCHHYDAQPGFYSDTVIGQHLFRPSPVRSPGADRSRHHQVPLVNGDWHRVQRRVAHLPCVVWRSHPTTLSPALS